MTEVRIKEPILSMMVVLMCQLILKHTRPIHVISLRLVWSIERSLKDTEQHNTTMVQSQKMEYVLGIKIKVLLVSWPSDN